MHQSDNAIFWCVIFPLSRIFMFKKHFWHFYWSWNVLSCIFSSVYTAWGKFVCPHPLISALSFYAITVTTQKTHIVLTHCQTQSTTQSLLLHIKVQLVHLLSNLQMDENHLLLRKITKVCFIILFCSFPILYFMDYLWFSRDSVEICEGNLKSALWF